MGIVYVATRLHIGDKVAVKVLHSNLMSDPTAGERFRREVQMAAQLKHPNAVSIYDYGQDRDNLHYIVMELVEGRTLRQLISKQGVLPLSVISDVASQVCAALDEAHRQGLIHRDIKPDNITVQETPDGLRVKVLDFGIAKLQESSSNLTQTDTIVGTPRYMSPEQCLGQTLSGSSDIYSFGVVLYEMLCGMLPFNAPTSMAVAVQQVTQPPPSLRQINNTISEEIEQVVLHALEKKPEDRPQPATSLAQELNDAIRGKKISQPDFRIPPSEYPSVPAVVSIPTLESQRETVGSSEVSKENEVSPVSIAVPSEENERPLNEANRTKTPLLIALLAIGLVFLVGIGSLAAWVFMNWGDKQTQDQPPIVIQDNTNSSNENTDPDENSADDELRKLSDERLASSPDGMSEIEEKLKKAEEKYPTDYRFTYQLAKLYAPLPKHDKSFDALFKAARKAINNDDSSKMLDEITRHTRSDFRRMAVGHGEWTAIINALKKKDASLLPK
jgi:serine/threonine protein kinase